MENNLAIACLPLGLLPSHTHPRALPRIYKFIYIYTVYVLIYAYRKHVGIEGNYQFVFLVCLFFYVR